MNKVPDEVVLWLRDWHNQLHKGSGVSVMQLIGETPKIESEWKAHCFEKNISSKNGDGKESYESISSKWIDANYGMTFHAYNRWKHAKSVSTILRRRSGGPSATRHLGSLRTC